ncbi:hypothetical protein MMC29_000677 [Sticta canariensis]|nr:hypothetical protein [Sticta canariensis]
MAAEGVEAVVAEALDGLVVQAVEPDFVDTIVEALIELVAQAVEPGLVDIGLGFAEIAAEAEVVNLAHQAIGFLLMLSNLLIDGLRVVLNTLLGIL